MIYQKFRVVIRCQIQMLWLQSDLLYTTQFLAHIYFTTVFFTYSVFLPVQPALFFQ